MGEVPLYHFFHPYPIRLIRRTDNILSTAKVGARDTKSRKDTLRRHAHEFEQRVTGVPRS